MNYSEPYKIQLNLEISNPNVADVLSQLITLANNNGIRASVSLSNSSIIPFDESLENQITALIHEIGIPSHIMGYQYLKDAVLITMEDRDAINSITKMLYPEIATRNNTTSSRVERAIRHAIEIAFTRGNTDFITTIFGYSINPNTGKPTNSEFIASISDYLRMNCSSSLAKISTEQSGAFISF